MNVTCPGCGAQLTVLPGYQQEDRVFEFAMCVNRACKVATIRIEWAP